MNFEGSRMVERRPHPEHGRMLSAYLTEKGAELVALAHGEVEAIEERMLAGLDHEERFRLLEDLTAGCVSVDGCGRLGA
jgi:DNA-binding MarR family transcriptional regulator